MLTATVALQDSIEDHKWKVHCELTWGYSLSCVADLVLEVFAPFFSREDVLTLTYQFYEALGILLNL